MYICMFVKNLWKWFVSVTFKLAVRLYIHTQNGIFCDSTFIFKLLYFMFSPIICLIVCLSEYNQTRRLFILWKKLQLVFFEVLQLGKNSVILRKKGKSSGSIGCMQKRAALFLLKLFIIGNWKKNATSLSLHSTWA